MSIIEDKFSQHLVSREKFLDKVDQFEGIALGNRFRPSSKPIVEERVLEDEQCLLDIFSTAPTMSVTSEPYTIDGIDARHSHARLQKFVNWITGTVILHSIRKAAIDYYTWDECGVLAGTCLEFAAYIDQRNRARTQLGFMIRRDMCSKALVIDLINHFGARRGELTFDTFVRTISPCRPIFKLCHDALVEIDSSLPSTPYLIDEALFYHHRRSYRAGATK